jgi:hypothetical protein
MTAHESDLNTPPKLDDRRAPDPSDAPAISSEPLVEPPSPASVPIAMIQQRGWMAGLAALLFAVLVLVWRRRRVD